MILKIVLLKIIEKMNSKLKILLYLIIKNFYRDANVVKFSFILKKIIIIIIKVFDNIIIISL